MEHTISASITPDNTIIVTILLAQGGGCWATLSPDQARIFGSAMLKQADVAEQRTREIEEVSI